MVGRLQCFATIPCSLLLMIHYSFPNLWLQPIKLHLLEKWLVALYRASAPFPVSRHSRLSPSSVGRLRQELPSDNSFLCFLPLHILGHFRPPDDVVRGVPFVVEEEGSINFDCLCQALLSPSSPTIAHPSTLGSPRIPLRTVVLPPLLSEKVRARLSRFCDVWRQKGCNGWVCKVLETGFHPRTCTPSPFVDKGLKEEGSLSLSPQNVKKRRDRNRPLCIFSRFLQSSVTHSKDVRRMEACY